MHPDRLKRQAYSIAAMRALAHRALPRVVFDFADGGAEILFSFRGYNWGVVKAAKTHHPLQPFERRAGLAALTLAAGDERYRWVNRVFAMLEADIVPYAAPELWRIRAFECVNDLIQAQA